MWERIVEWYLYVTILAGLFVGYPFVSLAERLRLIGSDYPSQMLGASVVGLLLVVVGVVSLFTPWWLYVLGAYVVLYVIGTYHTWKKWS